MERKIYIDSICQESGYLIVGGLSIIGQEFQGKFTEQFSTFYSSFSKETIDKIIYPSLSR